MFTYKINLGRIVIAFVRVLVAFGFHKIIIINSFISFKYQFRRIAKKCFSLVCRLIFLIYFKSKVYTLHTAYISVRFAICVYVSPYPFTRNLA